MSTFGSGLILFRIVQTYYPAGLDIKEFPVVWKWFDGIKEMAEVKRAYEKIENAEHV